MAHMIENNNMFSVRVEPWHKLGVVLDNPPTVEEGIQAAGMDWHVEKRQLGFIADNQEVIATEAWGLVRSKDQQYLGTVSRDYHVVQNRNAFGFFQPLLDSKDATLETAGVLRGGRQIWVLAKLDADINLPGDDVVRSYLLLTNGHDGRHAVGVQATPIRVVCNNTLQMSVEAGGFTKFAHVGGVEGHMAAYRDVLMGYKSHFKAEGKLYQRMLDTMLTQDGVEGLVNKVVGIDLSMLEPVDGDLMEAAYHQEARKEKILELHETGVGASGCRGTVWGVYNACTEFGDHYLAPKSRDRASYALQGAGAEFRNRAYTHCVAELTA